MGTRISSVMTASPYLNLLRNHIDITRVPFSDRGSRLLINQKPGESRLVVKLAERLTGLDPDIEAYLNRPPFIRDLSLIDEFGEVLDFDLIARPHVLYFHTRLGEFALVFQDRRTLSFGIPPQTTAGICFFASPQYWRKNDFGGTFKAVRNLTYASNGEIVNNQISPSEGGYWVEFTVKAEDDTAIILTIHPEINLSSEVVAFSVAHAAAESRWNEWFSLIPPVSEKYRRTYAYAWWVMANNLISPLGNVTYESMAPSKVNYVGLWLWDNAMHTLAFRHIDADLARNQIRAMIAHQLPNGMLPDAIFDEGVVSTLDHPIIEEVTKPPILAWAALKLHETDPNLEFLQEIYVPLMRLHSWWFGMNDDDADGLAQYNHPYSSGLDDSPLWDQGMPVESPDLNTYLCIQMGSLAVISELLGMEVESRKWRSRAAAIVNRMMKDFWDEEAGLFWALHNEEPIRVITPFNLYPLWTGQLSENIKNRLIAHLTDPEEFWGDYVIPTVARNDPTYSPKQMWRGPVWANINYFFIEALEQVHEFELARTLRQKTLDLIMSHQTISEFYNSETGEIPAGAADIFGWTASVFIDLAIKASREEEAESLRRESKGDFETSDHE
jgi:glycogen debranching enzyme